MCDGATWLATISAALVAVLTLLILRVYSRIAWLTGAMESHSLAQVRLAAASSDTPVEIIWWDPTVERVPEEPKHKEPASLVRIYMFLPPELRRNKGNWWDVVREVLGLPDRRKR